MKSKSKSILSMTMAVLFTLSVCYFALLTPTSAWFYNSNELENTFVFGDFDLGLDLPEDYVEYDLLKIRASTCFADKGEILFDDAVAVITIHAQNTGNVPARVYVTYDAGEFDDDPTSGNNKGLCYFFVGQEVDGDEVSFKTEIDRVLEEGGLEMIDYSQQLPSADYISQSKEIFEEHLKNGYVVVEPDATVDIKIAVWVDYLESAIKDNINVVDGTEFYNLQTTFRLSATQDTDGAFNVETRQIVVSPNT